MDLAVRKEWGLQGSLPIPCPPTPIPLLRSSALTLCARTAQHGALHSPELKDKNHFGQFISNTAAKEKGSWCSFSTTGWPMWALLQALGPLAAPTAIQLVLKIGYWVALCLMKIEMVFTTPSTSKSEPGLLEGAAELAEEGRVTGEWVLWMQRHCAFVLFIYFVRTLFIDEG